MSTPAQGVAAPKRCVVCGADCTGKPRVKDPSGRYFCRACYDAKAVAPGVAASDAPLDADAPFELEPLPPVAVAPGPGWVPQATTGAASRTKRAGPPLGKRLVDFLSEAPVISSMPTLVAFLILMGFTLPETIHRFSAFPTSFAKDFGWPLVIGICVLMSMLGAAVGVLIGPWWFRARLRWSKGPSIEVPISRIVYGVSWLPCVLWYLPLSLLMVAMDGAPTPERDGSGFFLLAVPAVAFILLVAGCAVTFLAAWQGFGAKPNAAVGWFIVLPVGWYSLQVFFLIAAIGSGAIDPGSITDPARSLSRQIDALRPDVANAKRHAPTAEAPYGFSYPGNWTLELTTAAPGAPFQAIQITAPSGAQASFVLLPPSSATTDAILDPMIAAARQAVGDGPVAERAMMGMFTGTGRVLKGTKGGRVTRVIAFVHTRSDGSRLLISTSRRDPDLAHDEAGLERIIDSLRLAPG